MEARRKKLRVSPHPEYLPIYCHLPIWGESRQFDRPVSQGLDICKSAAKLTLTAKTTVVRLAAYHIRDDVPGS